MGCWRPHFEGLSQQRIVAILIGTSCWRPHFEGLSQRDFDFWISESVVEDPILRGYHNILNAIPFSEIVVEDPILRGYHNHLRIDCVCWKLLKTPFWGVITTYNYSSFIPNGLLKTPFWGVITTVDIIIKCIVCCWSPHFEGLSQHKRKKKHNNRCKKMVPR